MARSETLQFGAEIQERAPARRKRKSRALSAAEEAAFLIAAAAAAFALELLVVLRYSAIIE